MAWRHGGKEHRGNTANLLGYSSCSHCLALRTAAAASACSCSALPTCIALRTLPQGRRRFRLHWFYSIFDEEVQLLVTTNKGTKNQSTSLGGEREARFE